MPSSRDILEGLTRISNAWVQVAVAWHLVLAVALSAFAAGWRPSRRLLASVSACPILSVAAVAWADGNPFNGGILSATAVALGLLGLREERARAGPAAPAERTAGVLLLGFGWIYPHFVSVSAPWQYLYAAPVGLVPCPTLSVVAGLTLAFERSASRAWTGVLAAAGLFYGFFGWLRLGVRLDIVLAAGSLLLVRRACFRPPIPAEKDRLGSP